MVGVPVLSGGETEMVLKRSQRTGRECLQRVQTVMEPSQPSIGRREGGELRLGMSESDKAEEGKTLFKEARITSIFLSSHVPPPFPSSSTTSSKASSNS